MSEEQTKKTGFFSRLLGREKAEDASARQPEHQPQDQTEGAVYDDFPLSRESVTAGSENESESIVGLKDGLTKTRRGFIRSLDDVFFGQKQLDDKVVARLEETLITADIGVQTAYKLLDSVTERVKRREIDDPKAVLGHIKDMITLMLLEAEAPLRVGYGTDPFVVMVMGVNGSGKTTSIAKIAARHRSAGRKVMMVAGDTFRAAAEEQLSIWAERTGCVLVRGKEKADPSSVVFEAMDRASKEDIELVLIDTAGRLHTRVPLMEELKKVHRTIGRKLAGAPHETLLVIDSSNGQNAIIQAKMFNEAIPVTGICLTKLDGTAKGGVIVGISNEMKIPIRFIGIGEKMDDLKDFRARSFVDALFDEEGLHREG
jgi:fused signal recognition particle receptor